MQRPSTWRGDCPARISSWPILLFSNRDDITGPAGVRAFPTVAGDHDSERDHAHPEHQGLADIDVVLARELELAVGADAENGQPRLHRAHLVAIAHVDRQVMLRDQQAAARVDMEGARMDAARLDVLDRLRLAGALIDRIDDDAVLAALEHLLAFEL